MKQLVLTALCALTLHASAQTTYGVGLAYEHDAATSNPRGLRSVSKAGVLAGVAGRYGQLDASLFEVRVRGERFYDSQPGVELGYGHGRRLGEVTVSGRVGLGKVYNRGLGAPEETGTYSTYTVSVGVPVTERVGVSVGARYRPPGDFDRQQQYTLGATYAASKSVMLLGGLRHTRSATTPPLNGASVQVRYYFR